MRKDVNFVLKWEESYAIRRTDPKYDHLKYRPRSNLGSEASLALHELTPMASFILSHHSFFHLLKPGWTARREVAKDAFVK
jgi:hypothetical protein